MVCTMWWSEWHPVRVTLINHSPPLFYSTSFSFPTLLEQWIPYNFPFTPDNLVFNLPFSSVCVCMYQIKLWISLLYENLLYPPTPLAISWKFKPPFHPSSYIYVSRRTPFSCLNDSLIQKIFYNRKTIPFRFGFSYCLKAHLLYHDWLKSLN